MMPRSPRCMPGVRCEHRGRRVNAGPRAVIFDCDGVIADTEPLHLRAFNQVLGLRGITLSGGEYAARYLGFDDRGVFAAVLGAHGRTVAPEEVAELIAEKARCLRGILEAEVRIYDGVVELVRTLAGIPLAVASGALRAEVEIVLARAAIREAFATVVAAEDVRAGKPDPEGFLIARAALERGVGTLAPASCLVVEDSRAGIEAARAPACAASPLPTATPRARSRMPIWWCRRSRA